MCGGLWVLCPIVTFLMIRYSFRSALRITTLWLRSTVGRELQELR